MEFSDEQLTKRCREELPYITTSFETLLVRYEALVFRTCLRYLGSHPEAEEACQDAFLRVFRGLPKFSGKSSFKTWLYRIVANVCATRYQRLKRDAERKADYFLAVQEERERVWRERNPSGTDDELSGPVADALARLTVEDRELILLRHISELTVPEIAAVLDLKLSAAKMRVSRAEKRFRESYETVTGRPLDKFQKIEELQ